jgi:hypothetical protein
MSEIICPHCKNPIYDEDALSCHFCGNSLARASGGAFGKMRGAGMKWVWITLVLVILAAVLLSIR